MKQRPLVIRLLSFLYFFSPLFILLELMWLHDIGPGKLFLLPYTISWHVFLLMVVTPFVGYAIWTVRKWGYYVLIAHSILLLFNNTILYFERLTTTPLWLIVIFNILVLVIIIAFVRKEVYAPYFNPQIRWWEQARRFYYNGMRILVKRLYSDDIMFEAKSFDLSETGLFVASGKNVSVGDKFSFEMVLKNSSILFADGEVMWINPKKKGDIPAGFGCRFLNIDDLFRKRIRYHLQDIEATVRKR